MASVEQFAGHVELPGVRLWYTDSGGTGVPVVLLHANTGNADGWQYNIPASSKPDIAPSLSIGADGAAVTRIRPPARSPAPSRKTSTRWWNT